MDYGERQKQKAVPEESYIKTQGIDYNGGDDMLTEIFEEPNGAILHTHSGARSVKRSMIYVISKNVDGRTFIKIGASRSTKSNTGGRLGDAQTMLIPGLRNAGFKVIYIFIYPFETLTGESYSESIEKSLHWHLRHETDYKETVLKFPTGNPSEWYLPEPKKYKEFFNEVLEYLSLQLPVPEAAYHFYRQGLRNRRTEGVVKETTKEDKLHYRHDFTKKKKDGEELHKKDLEDKAKKKGNLKYFRERLLKRSGNPLGVGENMRVKEVMYHSGKSRDSRIHGNYYVKVGCENADDCERERIPVRFTDDEGGEWSQMSNVLTFMKEVKTLGLYDLTTNYNHYHKGPIMRAAEILKLYHSDDNILLRKSNLEWLLGRRIRDSNDEEFEAVELIPNDATKRVTAVKYEPVKGGTAKEINPRMAIEMAIDFHKGNKSKHTIDDRFKFVPPKKVKTKYKKGDFIQFNKGYFKDDLTNKSLDEKYVALVLKDAYPDFDEEVNGFDVFYELLFQHELWFLNSKSVDSNSVKLSDEGVIMGFLATVTIYRNRLSSHLQQYGLPTSEVRNRTQKVVNRTPSKGTRKRNRK